MSREKFAHGCANLRGMGLEREMPFIQQAGVGAGQVPAKRARAHRQKEGSLWPSGDTRPLRADLGHPAPCRLGLQIGNELVEIGIVANVEADMHRPRKGSAP